MSYTCLETGRVTAVTASGELMVHIRRAEACHNCEARGVCQAFGGTTEDVVLQVKSSMDAEVGDEVVLSLPEASVIKASAALYLLPAAGLVLGALFGVWLLGGTIGDSDTAALIGAAAGLLPGLLAARFFGARMARKQQYLPTLVKVISRSPSNRSER